MMLLRTLTLSRADRSLAGRCLALNDSHKNFAKRPSIQCNTSTASSSQKTERSRSTASAENSSKPVNTDCSTARRLSLSATKYGKALRQPAWRTGPLYKARRPFLILSTDTLTSLEITCANYLYHHSPTTPIPTPHPPHLKPSTCQSAVDNNHKTNA